MPDECRCPSGPVVQYDENGDRYCGRCGAMLPGVAHVRVGP